MMQLSPLTRPHFSPDRGRERFWLVFCWLVTAVSALILVFFWPQTRSVEFIVYLQQFRSAPVEYLFRAFTFLGDDQFFMIFFGILLWCVSKPLGFWAAFVLLSSGTCSNFIKDVTLLERPPLEGISHPPNSWAFPSGHTLTAVTVWGYLAVRLKRRGFWAWALVAIIMIGISRLVLGYHFLGDVLGGLALGIPFLLVFIWLSSVVAEKGWADKLSRPLLLLAAAVVPVLLTAVLPGADPPKLLGYLAGAGVGYILEKEKVRSLTATTFPKQLAKALLGLAVLFGIILGLGGVLPSGAAGAPFAAKMVGFARYALGGLWVTLAAPALFVALKLTPRDKRL
jgi:membrane-associated phospholipid phosphatase